MTNEKVEVKIKVKVPTQAKRGLEWAPAHQPESRELVIQTKTSQWGTRNSIYTNKNAGEGARATQDCRSLARKGS